MANNYYLLNGKNGKGQALNVLANDMIYRNFEDISEIDLETIKIFYKDARRILKEYNPNIDLSGMFYNVLFYAKSNKIKSYATIFNYNSEDTQYYLDQLHYFAEQRKFKKKNGKNLKLDDNTILDEYIRKMMYNLLTLNDNKLTDYNSIISAKMKDIINDKFINYHNVGTNNYINSKIHVIKNLFSSYTELRNITLEYMLYIQKFNTNIRQLIKRTEHWDNYGIEQINPVQYDKNNKNNDVYKNTLYNQLQLSDFDKGIPRVKKK